MSASRPVVIASARTLLAAASLSLATTAFATDLSGLYVGGVPNVGLDWSSDFGSDPTAFFPFEPYTGPWFGPNSATVSGTSWNQQLSGTAFMEIDVPSSGGPATVHMTLDNSNSSGGSGLGVHAAADNIMIGLARGYVKNFRIEWSAKYTSINGIPGLGYFWIQAFGSGHAPNWTILNNVSVGGLNSSGMVEGSFRNGVGLPQFWLDGSLYQGQSYAGHGILDIVARIWVSEAPLPLYVPYDVNGDGAVNAADLSLVLGAWGTADVNADLNHDGDVDAADLSVLLGSWTG